MAATPRDITIHALVEGVTLTVDATETYGRLDDAVKTALRRACTMAGTLCWDEESFVSSRVSIAGTDCILVSLRCGFPDESRVPDFREHANERVRDAVSSSDLRKWMPSKCVSGVVAHEIAETPGIYNVSVAYAEPDMDTLCRECASAVIKSAADSIRKLELDTMGMCSTPLGTEWELTGCTGYAGIGYVCSYNYQAVSQDLSSLFRSVKTAISETLPQFPGGMSATVTRTARLSG